MLVFIAGLLPELVLSRSTESYEQMSTVCVRRASVGKTSYGSVRRTSYGSVRKTLYGSVHKTLHGSVRKTSYGSVCETLFRICRMEQLSYGTFLMGKKTFLIIW